MELTFTEQPVISCVTQKILSIQHMDDIIIRKKNIESGYSFIPDKRSMLEQIMEVNQEENSVSLLNPIFPNNQSEKILNVEAIENTCSLYKENGSIIPEETKKLPIISKNDKKEQLSYDFLGLFPNFQNSTLPEIQNVNSPENVYSDYIWLFERNSLQKKHKRILILTQKHINILKNWNEEYFVISSKSLKRIVLFHYFNNLVELHFDTKYVRLINISLVTKFYLKLFILLLLWSSLKRTTLKVWKLQVKRGKLLQINYFY